MNIKKAPLWKLENNFLCKRKHHFGLHLPFAINFMFELKMLFKKRFDITHGLIRLSYYITTSL